LTASVSSINKIRKKYGIKSGGSITSSQYREAQILSSSASSKTHSKSTNPYSFIYYITTNIEQRKITIKLVGKHLSKNRFDSLSKWGVSGQKSYIKAIKKSSYDCYLVNRKMFFEFKKNGLFPLKKATVEYIFYNVSSRDEDGNSETIKRLQDTFTTMGIIIDDKRSVLTSICAPREVLITRGSEYYVEAILRF